MPSQSQPPPFGLTPNQQTRYSNMMTRGSQIGKHAIIVLALYSTIYGICHIVLSPNGSFPLVVASWAANNALVVCAGITLAGVFMRRFIFAYITIIFFVLGMIPGELLLHLSSDHITQEPPYIYAFLWVFGIFAIGMIVGVYVEYRVRRFRQRGKTTKQ